MILKEHFCAAAASAAAAHLMWESRDNGADGKQHQGRQADRQ